MAMFELEACLRLDEGDSTHHALRTITNHRTTAAEYDVPSNTVLPFENNPQLGQINRFQGIQSHYK